MLIESIILDESFNDAQQKKDSIVVYKDDTKQVVVPLTKEASIQYGKNTSWRTSATGSKNYFTDYFYINKITLFYVLFKDGNKYGCAFHPEKPDTIESFNQADKRMYFVDFEEATGISKKDIQNWYNSNKSKIENSNDLNKCSEEVQLSVVNDNARNIEFIDNPSEEAQIAAVKQYSSTIKYIIAKGIVPSKEYQLAAASTDGNTIYYIDNPSEEVQLAAVKEYGMTIKYIIEKGIVPSEEVQLAAVTQSGRAIQFIDNPNEKFQLVAVTQNGYAIRDIIAKGIVPSDEVQLAAVSQDGRAIAYIDNPSEELQLAAVTSSRYAIEHIDNPSEKVKALQKKLWGQ